MKTTDPKISLARSINREINIIDRKFFFWVILIIVLNTVTVSIISLNPTGFFTPPGKFYALLAASVFFMLVLIAVKIYFGRAVDQIEKRFYEKLDQTTETS